MLLLECPALFDRAGVYGYGEQEEFPDTLARLTALGRGALSAPDPLDWTPDVLHVHDASATPAAIFQALDQAPGRKAAGSLLTIHNLAHQSLHPAGGAKILGVPSDLEHFPGPLEFYGQVSLMKAGILLADRVNTVSSQYAREVVADEEMGCGLAGVLRSRGDAFGGIRNGMDRDAWNPATDPALAAPYDAGDLDGKAACRAALLAEMGLSDGGPVLGLVGRLARQKGYDLLLPLLDGMIAAGWRLAALGSGDKGLADGLREAARRHPGSIAFRDVFDEPLSRRIIAGSDVFAMPSRFEPCGLTQMYALRYGTPPVVRRTGGLADTVRDVAETDGTGFVFDAAEPAALGAALDIAAEKWQNPAEWRALVLRGMAEDLGWDGPAAEYENVYDQLCAERGGGRIDDA